MSVLRTLWQCMFSPRLFRTYEIDFTDKPYEARNVERWGDRVIVSFATMWSISLYALPFVATFLYRRGYPLADNIYYLAKVAAGAGAILIASLVVRGCSRATNPTYQEFLRTLNKARHRYNAESKHQLYKYDFEFWAWPVDFRVLELEGGQQRKRKVVTTDRSERSGSRRRGGSELLLALPCRLISYIVAHTFAVKLMYPGSISVINYAIGAALLQGRIDLLKRGGERSKLETADGNHIDVMFVDQRNKEANGHILVITCEGNCGFYEIGVITTPLNKGYSVLGWNHPGFGDSTILDATFDDVMPLALSRMPAPLEGVVRTTVREHLNLNVAEQLNRYNGPVLLIRRTEDEMICAHVESSSTDVGSNNASDDCNLAGNRGNNLLAKLLARRYPRVLTGAKEASLLKKFFLAATPQSRRTLLEEIGVDEGHCLKLVADNLTKHGGTLSYPSDLGEDSEPEERLRLTLFLATKYMKDQHSQHCDPLLRELFHPGWDPAASAPFPCA